MTQTRTLFEPAVFGDVSFNGSFYFIGQHPYKGESGTGRALRHFFSHVGEPVSLETIAKVSSARFPRRVVAQLSGHMLGSDYFRISHVGDRRSGMYSLHEIGGTG